MKLSIAQRAFIARAKREGPTSHIRVVGAQLRTMNSLESADLITSTSTGRDYYFIRVKEAANTYSQVESEMFKAWADNHPTLFTSAVFDFMQQHPAPQWVVTVAMRTPHRIVFTAKRVQE